LHKQNPKIIEGTSYTEGIDFELEDQIDFTDPADKHPSREARRTIGHNTEAVKNSKIVKKNGLHYREVVGQNRGSYFSYRFEFKNLGSFYLLELEYPDDKHREIQASISLIKPDQWSPSMSGVGAETGGKFFISNKMKKLYWVHVATEGIHSIDIVNGKDGSPAAAGKFKIYKINGTLPALRMGSRRKIGIHSERSTTTSGIGNNFGIKRLTNKKERADDEKLHMMQRYVADLVWTLDTTDRYIQYLKFTGQNTHIMGCMQYCDDNTPSVRPNETGMSRIPMGFRSILSNMFETNNISYYAGLEVSQFRPIRTNYNDAQVAKGKESIWNIDKHGKQFMKGRLETTCMNWQHPKFQHAFGSLLEELVEKFGHHKNFKGFHFLTGPMSHGIGYWLPGFASGVTKDYSEPFAYSFDDVTFEKFEKDTGIKLFIDKTDPMRFDKRYTAVTSPALKQKFIDWRCRKLRDFFADALKVANKSRKDLQFINAIAIEDPNFYKSQLAREIGVKENYKLFGYDLDLLNKVENLWNGRWTVSWQESTRGVTTQNPYVWYSRTDKEVTSAYDRDTNRTVMSRTSWDENFVVRPGEKFNRYGKNKVVESDWILNYYRVRTLPHPTGYNCREAMMQGIITADPQIIWSGFTDLNINVGFEQQFREISKVLSQLPEAKFKNALKTGLDTNFAIRSHSENGKSWIYVANPGYWSITGSITVRAKGKITDLATGKSIKTASGETEIPVKLLPYGLAAYMIDSAGAEAVSYKTGKITSEEINHMAQIIKRVAKLTNDPEVGLVLIPEDKKYMTATLKQAEKDLQDGKFASCWSSITYWRFWTLWKQSLEKALIGQASIPAEFKKKNSIHKPLKVNEFTAQKRSGKLTIDGKLDEGDWKKNAFVTGFIDIDGVKSVAETGIQILYDQDNLYFGFICAEKNMDQLQTTATKENEVINSKDDAVDFFIQPDENTKLYYQIALTAGGIQFDQKVKSGKRDYVYHPDWKYGVYKGKKYWSAEMAFPVTAFWPTLDKSRNWRVNFFRFFRNTYLPIAMWSKMPEDLHSPEKFGRLVFN
ncbi:MAG: DOMON domain-containing protein, partial [Planctomycetota bacterium]